MTGFQFSVPQNKSLFSLKLISFKSSKFNVLKYFQQNKLMDLLFFPSGWLGPKIIKVTIKKQIRSMCLIFGQNWETQTFQNIQKLSLKILHIAMLGAILMTYKRVSLRLFQKKFSSFWWILHVSLSIRKLYWWTELWVKVVCTSTFSLIMPK